MHRSTHREVSSCDRVVELPEIVRHEAPGLAAVCSPEAFAPLQRDSSGVRVSANQTVDGSNRIGVIDRRPQRRWHRW